MSEQTTTTEDKLPMLEPLSDILLVLDKIKNKIEAVKGVDEAGNLKTVAPKKANLLEFMRVDRGDAFSNFFSNFLRRLNDPLAFRFFKAPVIQLNEITRKLQHAIDNPSPEGNKLLDALEVYDNKLKKQEKMETNQTASGQAPKEETKPTYKYNASDIDWDSLEKLNLNKELLEKNGQMDKLLKGYKTDGVYRIAGNFDGVVMNGDARLALRNVNGKVTVMIHGVRAEPDLKTKFYGHAFTAEDRENLLKTGNMGRVAELTNYLDGTKVKNLISIDKLTKEVISFPVDLIKINEKFGGVKLSKEQKTELLEGKSVLVEGMANTKTGQLFSQRLQFSADDKKLVFVGKAETPGYAMSQGIRDEFRGKTLTTDEKKLLEEGNVIHLKDILNKEGTRLYSGYLWYNKEAGKLDFDLKDPQLDKNKRQSENSAVEASETNNQKTVSENAVQNGRNKRSNTSKPKLH
ncbi:DUF3945 domain-containing protein [Elizabethkingia ursingii]|uniref:DUF3945 domain-containing protein n=1 Tax=Elizabethkingia ursingii TaxID=1756150 RepID=UPI00201298E1|nr:DUF3945 domain-containing protein [Elizabethkingia ursingii]MCL1666554.1 DUF3945 domain-containing protein [Elizabethkingia ursingii]